MKLLILSHLRKVIILFGLSCIGLMFLTEVRNISGFSIGPYQFFGIVLGIILIFLGLSRWRSKQSYLLVFLLVIIMGTGLLEAMLTLRRRLILAITHPERSTFIEEEQLILIAPPNSGDHDSRGWRNPIALNQANIVAIGDSQTWGVNATINQTWYQVMGELTNRTVYGMAQGSYGPVQYAILTERALELSPDIIVVGIYMGSDIMNNYSSVYKHDLYTELRNDNFIDTQKPSFYESQAKEISQHYEQFIVSYIEQNQPILANDLVSQFRLNTQIGRWLIEIGILEHERTVPIEWEAYQAWINDYPEFATVFNDNGILTFFHPSSRLWVVAHDDPRLDEGLRIMENRLTAIQQTTLQAGVKLIILLIPTKEMVYVPFINTNQIHAQLAEDETYRRNQIITFLENNEIAYVDALPALQDAVQRNQTIYPRSFDGHPEPQGYFVIGQAVAEFINDG